jgi:hypothetical protein
MLYSMRRRDAPCEPIGECSKAGSPEDIGARENVDYDRYQWHATRMSEIRSKSEGHHLSLLRMLRGGMPCGLTIG